MLDSKKMSLALLLLLFGGAVCLHIPPPPPNVNLYEPADDVILPKQTGPPIHDRSKRQAQFKFKWLGRGGTIHEDEAADRLEVAATLTITEEAHQVGSEIVGRMLRNVPDVVFDNMLATDARVGLFTTQEGTTIFPEYEQYRDRPECAGICSGACSNTCTSDGRKYDSLAGLGGIRATCLDDNFMCTSSDPYRNTYSVLVHEFAHTLHQYGLPTETWNQIYAAWLVAPWDQGSYAMSNHLEYFAEGSGVYFDTNRHSSSSGGMNGCGRPAGQYCADEDEGRDWLDLMDPELYDALSYSYTEREDMAGNLAVCVVLKKHKRKC